MAESSLTLEQPTGIHLSGNHYQECDPFILDVTLLGDRVQMLDKYLVHALIGGKDLHHGAG